MPPVAIAFVVLSGLLCLLSLYWAVKAHRQHKVNVFVSDELQKIIDSTNHTIGETKKTIAESRAARNANYGIGHANQDIFEQPELMATIITVLIHKFGDVRLSLKDFMIQDDDYVSVYVDTQTQEIILSLDKQLELRAQFPGITNPDDNTFH
tara:strand:- start:710 stop:1165 length:456 start_codon:yes stop_codon:yes gene_type:complete